jgi:colanic acid/amylovoran biosynthesis protein
MKILLVGNGSRQNRGCEAISITTIEMIKHKFPHAEIEILSFNPEIDSYFKVEHGIDVGLLYTDAGPKPDFLTRIKRKLHFLPEEECIHYSPLRPYIDKLNQCDLVLSLGGDNYTDDYGIPNLFWELAIWAERFRKPFVIWGASVGPFKSHRSLKIAKQALKAVNMVTAREGVTVSYLKSIGYLGEVVRVHDSAFYLQTKQVDLPAFGREADMVGLNISPIYYRYSSKTSEEILAISKIIVKRLSEKYNVLLIPHVMCGPGDNDALYMQDIEMENSHSILASPDYDCMMLKYLISKCKFFIGARTHATIAAFSTGVPTLSLGYSSKAKGINLELFGHEDYLIAAQDFCEENILNKIKVIENNLHTIRKELIGTQSATLEKKNNGIDAVARIVKNETAECN